ncbi:putative oxido [Cyphellophora attinorum]|uniref:D-xylose reductase [NAD(P)H] n=1 Tax=Cyphellophora attinorum TaxID=1664694 RepID=A0A0N0NJQ4_9EURO|nr:putative oxido [Phialophora attinorum]KPI37158.1 putative oxido [Phialophora attinorum]
MLNTLTAALTCCLLLTIPAHTFSLPPILTSNEDHDHQKPIKHPKHHPPLDIPFIGLGLWNSKGSDATHAVDAAFGTGYIHFDSAAAYSNEEYVGSGLTNVSIPRSSYWITSKLWNTAHQPSLVEPALRKTLSDLQTPYLDLYLMHWPVAFVPNPPKGRNSIIDQDTSILNTWRAMESLVHKNLTRYIGVSNFSPRQLDTILAACKTEKGGICPYAHEFETHPYLQQTEFVEWHLKHDIKVIAYSPLANLNPTYNGTHSDVPSILEDPFWQDLAANKSITVPQAVLGWGIQRGTVVIPKSVHAKRIKENLGAVDVNFTGLEMARIAEEDRRVRFNDPTKGWGVEPPLFEGLDGGSNRFVVEQEEL